jgi:hypothetical protein
VEPGTGSRARAAQASQSQGACRPPHPLAPRLRRGSHCCSGMLVLVGGRDVSDCRGQSATPGWTDRLPRASAISHALLPNRYWEAPCGPGEALRLCRQADLTTLLCNAAPQARKPARQRCLKNRLKKKSQQEQDARPGGRTTSDRRCRSRTLCPQSPAEAGRPAGLSVGTKLPAL